MLRIVGNFTTPPKIEGSIEPLCLQKIGCARVRRLSEKKPIAPNNVLNFYQQRSSDLQRKGNLSAYKFKHHTWDLEQIKKVGTSLGKKTEQNIDRINNNPLSAIVTLLIIYW